MHILYAGHFGLGTGYARAATDNFRALMPRIARSDEPLSLHLMQLPSRDMHTAVIPPDLDSFNVAHRAPDAPVDAVIIHDLPLSCERHYQRIVAMLPHSPRAKLIAYTTWETPNAPLAVRDAFTLFHEVWTPSRASQRALQLDDQRVHVIPHTFNPRDPHVELAMKHADGRPGHPEGSAGRVRFYWIGAWNVRKNPMGIIRAFCHQFDKGDDVELHLHSPGADLVYVHGALAQTGLTPADCPPITITTDYLSDEALWQLHMRGDVYVSASRGEAWNLPAFEAMLAGKIVMAPEGLGSDDFLVGYGVQDDTTLGDLARDGTNALMIPTRPDIAQVTAKAVPGPSPNQIGFVTEGAQGLTSKCLWYEPDHLALSHELHTAKWMVRRGIGGRLYYDPIARYGYDAVAGLMIERIRA